MRLLVALFALAGCSSLLAADYELGIHTGETRTIFKINLTKDSAQLAVETSAGLRSHKLSQGNIAFLRERINAIFDYEQPKQVQCPRNQISLVANDEKMTRLVCQNARSPLAEGMRSLISTLLAFDQVHKNF